MFVRISLVHGSHDEHLFGKTAHPGDAMMSMLSVAPGSLRDTFIRRPPDSSLAMAAVLGMCTWPLNFFLEGEFTLSSFGLGFPLDVLAAAAVTVYGYTPTDTMQVTTPLENCACCKRSGMVAASDTE